MKLKYLGTAASEAIPALFCQCDVCRKAREKGGRHIRSRSQALVDDSLLIDFPCDTCWHMVQNGLSLLDFNHCLITHVHDDHFSPEQIAYIRRGYASVLPENYGGFHIYGSEDIAAPLDSILQSAPDRLFCHPVEPYAPFMAGDYRVTALKARHGTPHPYNYLIERNGKALLYAHDTGHFFPETWDYLASHPVHIGLVSFDCTFANSTRGDAPRTGHMGMGDNILMRDKLFSLGLADANTRFVLNHFSHNGPDVDYDAFCAMAEKEGFAVSYDGMEWIF